MEKNDRVLANVLPPSIEKLRKAHDLSPQEVLEIINFMDCIIDAKQTTLPLMLGVDKAYGQRIASVEYDYNNDELAIKFNNGTVVYHRGGWR